MTPFDTTPRKNLTKKQRAALFARDGGRCQYKGCGKQIRPGDIWHDDHIKSLENGGSNEMSNRQVICEACHVLYKTPEDRKEAKINRRKFTKHVVPSSYDDGRKKKIPSRPFTSWRKFNGDKVYKRYHDDTDDETESG